MSNINPAEIDKILYNSEFSGSIHIMKNGEELYHRSMGWADYEAQYSFTDTAMIILSNNVNSHQNTINEIIFSTVLELI